MSHLIASPNHFLYESPRAALLAFLAVDTLDEDESPLASETYRQNNLRLLEASKGWPKTLVGVHVDLWNAFFEGLAYGSEVAAVNSTTVVFTLFTPNLEQFDEYGFDFKKSQYPNGAYKLPGKHRRLRK